MKTMTAEKAGTRGAALRPPVASGRPPAPPGRAAPGGAKPRAAVPQAPVLDDPYGILGDLDEVLAAPGRPGISIGMELASALSLARGIRPDAMLPAEPQAQTQAQAQPQPQLQPPMPAARGRHAASKMAVAAAAAMQTSTTSTPPVVVVPQVSLLERETCTECGGQMHRGMSNLEYLCSNCGLRVEGDTAEPEDDEAPRQAPNTARLRIVGPNSNQLQPDLYRSGSGDTAATQKKQILEEYKAYRQLFIEAGGRAFPLNAISLATDLYNDVQKQYVKRSQNKKVIMGACLFHASMKIGFAPSKPEIAHFMQLRTKGIARGDNFVRSLVAEGQMDLEIDNDTSRAEITTLFAYLGFEDEKYTGLRDAVHDVVQTALNNQIGVNSILRSKVAGATYVVLRRCQDRDLIPKPMSIQEFCDRRIRKNTVERFIRALDDFHSYFEECYRKAGLDSAPVHGK